MMITRTIDRRFVIKMKLCLVFLSCGMVAMASSPPPAAFKPSDDFLFLFLNPAISDNEFTTDPQLKLAEAAGINKFTFFDGGVPFAPNASASDWAASDELISHFIKSSPKAEVAPRIPLVTNVGDAGLSAASAAVYQDGPSTILDWTDPKVQDAAAAMVRSAVTRYEASSYGKQIWAYHISARDTGEWIPEYRERGIDYSEPNEKAFRLWLRTKYRTDASFAHSWGSPSMRLDFATVPYDSDGRFPLKVAPPEQKIEAFYRLPTEQNWVDYSEFISDNNAACIERLAAEAKKACSYKKAVITFYGYIFELPGSICGHLCGSKILRDPNIDYIAAPISYAPYTQRLSGGTGAPIGVVDSVELHGKTWINEDDLHTHARPEGVKIPSWYWDVHAPGYSIPANAAETSGILERNLAFAAFHQSATWWMDLYGGGWYTDPALWQIWQGPFGASMRKVRHAALPYVPTVAVIVDEESRFYEKFTWAGFYDLYPNVRNAIQGSGTSVGFYYLDDYLKGLVPNTEATIFVNLWHLDPERRKLLAARAHDSNTVIWQYAPGYMDPDRGGVSAIQELTGIKVKQDEGHLGSTGVGPLARLTFGGNNPINPRITIDDSAATPLAQYKTDKMVSAAMKLRDGVREVLIADDNWTPELVHRLLQFTGVHLNADAPVVVEAGKSSLFVYARQSGHLKVMAPPHTSFEDGSVEQTVDLKQNEHQLWALQPKD
jgi:hypothetical protein